MMTPTDATLPDTHAHLEADAFDHDRDAVVTRALEAGVDRILAVGSDLASSRKAIMLAHRYPSVYAAVGVHPHEAERFEAEAEEVRDLLKEQKVVAIGEVGLDYVRPVPPMQVQVEAFRRQVEWAVEVGLPVSVHNREADGDVMGLLKEMGATAILHCFTGPWDLAYSALEERMYLSFAGNVTFPKASHLREVAAWVPADRILVETDSPVLAPQAWRGRRNEPAHVVAVAEAVARERSTSLPELASVVSQNADRVFSWRAP